jgi:hypothetical protein
VPGLQLLERVTVGPAYPPALAHLEGVVMGDEGGPLPRRLPPPPPPPPPPNDRSMNGDRYTGAPTGEPDPWDLVLLVFGALLLALIVWGVLYVRV